MKFNQITFFAESDKNEKAKLTAHINYDKSDPNWPITFRINQTPGRDWASPQITIFIESREQLLDFIESIQKAFDRYATEFSEGPMEDRNV